MNQSLKLPKLPQSISPNERIEAMESVPNQLEATSNNFVQNLDQVLSTFLGFSKKGGDVLNPPRIQLLNLLQTTTIQID